MRLTESKSITTSSKVSFTTFVAGGQLTRYAPVTNIRRGKHNIGGLLRCLHQIHPMPGTMPKPAPEPVLIPFQSPYLNHT